MRVKDQNARKFYEIESLKSNWNVRGAAVSSFFETICDAFRKKVRLYGRKRKMMDMKAIERVVFAALGFLCLAFVACTKVEKDPYSDYAWTGEYPIKTQNGTTGEMEDHTGVIMLQFLNNGIECIVDTGISGMISTNRRKFEARWSGKDSFALYRTSGHQSLLEYSGTITGDKMTLQALNCDSVAATYELSRISLLE